MGLQLKITTIGNSVGVILPKEILEKLRVGKGDLLQVLEVPGGITLTSFDATFDKQMDIAERVMRRRRDVLKKLAE